MLKYRKGIGWYSGFHSGENKMKNVLQQRLLEIDHWKNKEKVPADGDSLRCLASLIHPNKNNYKRGLSLVLFFGIEKQAYEYLQNSIRRLK